MSEVQIVKSFLEELSKTPRNHPDSIPVEKIDETAISVRNNDSCFTNMLLKLIVL